VNDVGTLFGSSPCSLQLEQDVVARIRFFDHVGRKVQVRQPAGASKENSSADSEIVYQKLTVVRGRNDLKANPFSKRPR
jgi:hypothetical protein